MTTILGIDPGATGAIAMIQPMVETWDMPATPHDLAALLRTFDPATTMVYVEHVHSMPKQGVASTFKFGVGFGTILGALAALGIPHRLVPPQLWKRQMGVTADKASARKLAQQMYPTASLARVKDDGRAEALLIATWGKRQP
jgi:hypothetical protein